MGGLFSKSNSGVEDLFARISELEKHIDENISVRLASMEEYADADGDGVVTREEMENYLAIQIQSRESDIITLKEKYQAEKDKYRALKKQFDDLKDGILAENPDIATLPISTISKKRIQDYVDELMSTSEGNLDMVPDMIERPLKVKKYKTMLELIEQISRTTTFEIAGHKIQISISPL